MHEYNLCRHNVGYIGSLLEDCLSWYGALGSKIFISLYDERNT